MSEPIPICGGCASAKERCGSGSDSGNPTTAVRYGKMGLIGEFSHPPNMPITCAGSMVINTERGIEIGQQVRYTCFGCETAVPQQRMREYAQISGGDVYKVKAGRILREATEEDLHEWRHIQDGCFEKANACNRIARELALEMKVVEAEHVFGGERVIFYFMAEGRIDFRELVRRLAGEYQTRIEMRQIGARDEARLIADYETCGRECCCRNFLKTLKPVSMSMAKIQMTTLDLAKVSGRCGRLKCCLRYEHEGYSTLDKKLPKIGRRVVTEQGTGRVVDRQVLTQLVRIQTDEGQFVTVPAEEVIGPDRPVARAPEREETAELPPRAKRRKPRRPDDRSLPESDPGATRGLDAEQEDGVDVEDSESGLADADPPASPADASPTDTADSGDDKPSRRGPRRGRRGRRGRRRKPGGEAGGKGDSSPG